MISLLDAFLQVKKHFADAKVVQVLYFYCCVPLRHFYLSELFSADMLYSYSFMNIFIASVSAARSWVCSFSKVFSSVLL